MRGWGVIRWREAMTTALYGAGGFYTRPGPGPAAHFRTSAHASPRLAEAPLRLLAQVDQAPGKPDPLVLVGVRAGGGELLSALRAPAPRGLAARLRRAALELAPGWRSTIRAPMTGLMRATECFDNVSVDVGEVDPAGTVRYVLVDPE